MDQKQFVRTVAERSRLSREESADITRAVLEGLADQLSEGEARRLAIDFPVLPEQAQAPRRRRKGAHPVKLHDFVRQLSERAGLPEGDARAGTRAVLAVLREVLGEEGHRHLMSQLPAEYSELAEVAGNGLRPAPVRADRPVIARYSLGTRNIRSWSMPAPPGLPCSSTRTTRSQ
jgi:uncharacterized protein (DUF2267 family)